MSTAKEAFGGVALGARAGDDRAGDDSAGDDSAGDDSAGDDSAEPLFPAATKAAGLLFLSGQAPIDPATRAVCSDDFGEQAAFVLDQIAQTLAAAGAGLADVLRVECILARAEDFAAWNELFAARFPAPRPARTTFVASFVIPGMLLEIQATASA